MTLTAGVATRDITAFVDGIPLMGWAIHHNVARSVAMPLACRAFVLAEGRRRIAYACCEIAIMTDAVRDAVLERLALHRPDLEIGDGDLTLAATHSHSGPGGYSHHLFYNLTNPGFSPRVLGEIVDGIFGAICEAADTAEPAEVRVGKALIDDESPVAFNRSIEAYNANRDVIPVTWRNRHRATNRELVLMRIDSPEGRPIGAINWFAVHGTSIHSDHTVVHPDNKGVAARLFEEHVRTAHSAPGFVAAFAQGAAGDVSPNFRYDRRRRLMVGASKDDLESAHINGSVQCDAAIEAFADAGRAQPEPARVALVTRWVDFTNAVAEPTFTEGVSACRTGPARVGLTFLEGTLEGPGPLLRVPAVARVGSRVARLRNTFRRVVGRRLGSDFDDVHGEKYPFLDTGRGGRGLAFGVFRSGRPLAPGFLDPVVRAVKDLARIDAVGDGPWTPNVLPVQLLVIGGLAVATLPAEPTTQAGRRMRRALVRTLEDQAISRVVVAGYSNAYSGYVTTAEEYAQQRYEGASTLFGRWTLAVYQTVLDRLASDLGDGPDTDDFASKQRPHLRTRHEVWGQVWPGDPVAGRP